jgi:hypothetical protein
MGTSPRPRFRVLGLEQIEALPIPGDLRWRPVRAALGVRAFGVASFHAARAGEDVVEPHVDAEGGRGHEELYVVVKGRVTFTLDEQTFDAPAGTLVFVQPEAFRHGVAAEPDTEVLAFGGDPVFTPSGSEYIWRVRAERDPRRAWAIAEEAPADTPGGLYARALAAHAAGEDPRAYLDRAIALEPRLTDEARADGLP